MEHKVENLKNNNQKAAVFYERGSWHYRTKSIAEDFTIKYGKKGGYETEEEAKKHFWADRKQFEQEVKRYKAKQNPNFTFTGYLTYWFQKVFFPRVSGQTKVGFSYILYHILLPRVERDVLLTMVTTDYIDELMESCAKHSESTGPQTQILLRVAFKDAVIDGYIKNNPMLTAKPYYAKVPAIKILTKEQIRVLLDAASRCKTLYLEILLALFCGLRKGEIQGLKFTDFNYEERSLHIQRQITRDYNIEFKETSESEFSVKHGLSVKPPKSANSNRVLQEIPEIIFSELDKRIELIRFWKENYGERYNHQNDEYVIVSRLGELKSQSTLNMGLSKLCERNGLPHVTMHGLRHMFATILIEQGLPLLKISRLLGHQSIHTTFEIYCGIMEGLNEIGEFVDNNFDPCYANFSQQEVSL